MTREEQLDWLYRLRSKMPLYMPNDWVIPMNNALDMAIKALEKKPCEDAVSRQAVLEVLKNNKYRFNISQEGYCEGKVLWSENLIKDDACKEIEQLPSVTPTRKKGKWIVVDNIHSQCMECGAIFCISSSDEWGINYCPNCGAEMESEE